MEITSANLSHSFFEAHYIELQFSAIFGGMVILFLIEGFISRKTTEASQTSRWLSNIGLAFFNHFLIIFYAILVIGVISKLQPDSPLLKHFQFSDISAFIIVFLIMEFTNYWIHRAFHRVPILWRIHAVHHSDTEIDVTTSHRHHPFEPMITALLTTPIVFALGAPFIIVATHNLLQTALSLISHGNISIPQKLDNILRLFIITPDFHRMHHSSNKKYTDSNYSAIVPWFDYLFRTSSRLPYDKIPKMELGLKTFRKPADNRLDKLLITPFIYKPDTSNKKSA